MHTLRCSRSHLRMLPDKSIVQTELDETRFQNVDIGGYNNNETLYIKTDQIDSNQLPCSS